MAVPRVRGQHATVASSCDLLCRSGCLGVNCLCGDCRPAVLEQQGPARGPGQQRDLARRSVEIPEDQRPGGVDIAERNSELTRYTTSSSFSSERIMYFRFALLFDSAAMHCLANSA